MYTITNIYFYVNKLFYIYYLFRAKAIVKIKKIIICSCALYKYTSIKPINMIPSQKMPKICHVKDHKKA